MCLLIFLFSFDLDIPVLFGLDKKPPIELFFFGHVDGKNMVVSKRIQILNRQFNSLIVMQISISTMWALYYAKVSNINCWSQSERGSVQFLDASPFEKNNRKVKKKNASKHVLCFEVVEFGCICLTFSPTALLLQMLRALVYLPMKLLIIYEHWFVC